MELKSEKRLILPVLMLALGGAIACSQEAARTEPAAQGNVPAQAAPAGEKKEHVFRGKVEQVDAAAKKLTVNGENVEGWMSAMTMIYTADNAAIFEKIKAGDQITAKVYDGDFSTLHSVEVVP